jgi:hypothetical protein
VEEAVPRRTLQAEVAAAVVLVARRILMEALVELGEHQFQQAEEAAGEAEGDHRIQQVEVVVVAALADPRNRPLTTKLRGVGAAQSQEEVEEAVAQSLVQEVEGVGDYLVSEAAVVAPNTAQTGLRVLEEPVVQ